MRPYGTSAQSPYKEHFNLRKTSASSAWTTDAIPPAHRREESIKNFAGNDTTSLSLCVTCHSITLTALCSFPLCHYSHHSTLCLCLSQQFITIALQYHALPLRFIPQLYFSRLHNALARRCRSIPSRIMAMPSRNGALHCLCFSTQVSAATAYYCASLTLFRASPGIALQQPCHALPSEATTRLHTTIPIRYNAQHHGALPFRGNSPRCCAVTRYAPI